MPTLSATEPVDYAVLGAAGASGGPLAADRAAAADERATARGAAAAGCRLQAALR